MGRRPASQTSGCLAGSLPLAGQIFPTNPDTNAITVIRAAIVDDADFGIIVDDGVVVSATGEPG